MSHSKESITMVQARVDGHLDEDAETREGKKVGGSPKQRQQNLMD